MEFCPVKEFNWCVNNGIRIYPTPLDNYGRQLKIIIEINGKQHIGKEIYNNKNIHSKIYDLYVELYNKEQSTSDKEEKK